jgi:pilus assembly protein CpaB
MWKVKRMYTARMIVLTIALGAGGIAAYPASGSDDTSAQTEPVAHLQVADVVVAKSDTGPGQAVKPQRTPA